MAKKVIRAQDIYTQALALLGETEQETRAGSTQALGLINQLLAECLPINNNLRASKAKEPLEDIPLLESMEEAVGLEPDLCRLLLPPGLASLLILEDDATRSAYFDLKYQQGMAKLERAVWQETEDWY